MTDVSNNRTLSPLEWFNRLSSLLSVDCEVNCMDRSTSVALLKCLSERANAFDALLGSSLAGELGVDEVKTYRTLFGSLKKYRGSIPGVDNSSLTSTAMQRFKDNNRGASQNRIPARFVPYMREYLAESLKDFDSLSQRAIPRFGNGGVEEKVTVLSRWSHVVEQVWFDFRDPLDLTAGLGTGRVAPDTCRLHAVPKDWNKHRLITIEPYAKTYLQQTVRSEMLLSLFYNGSADLKRMAKAEWLPGGFDPQAAHRFFALEGSVDGHLATLDLSDASDFISFDQVSQVFPGLITAQLERARSTKYIDPVTRESGEMAMFAGMGNATTFVVETLMFHAACHAIARYHRVARPRISVFGDDIVCSSELATLIVDLKLFDEFGWHLNVDKSYFRDGTYFRESCGVQAFKGHDVTLLRYMGQYNGTGGLLALCDLVRRTQKLKFDELLTEPWPECSDIPNIWPVGPLPSGGCFSAVPYWPESTLSCRYNHDLQRSEVLLPTVRSKRRFVKTWSLGPVYGAISGQLNSNSAMITRRGRRVAGVWQTVQDGYDLVSEWFPFYS